jgi:hypothetical protein
MGFAVHDGDLAFEFFLGFMMRVSLVAETVQESSNSALHEPLSLGAVDIVFFGQVPSFPERLEGGGGVVRGSTGNGLARSAHLNAGPKNAYD